MSMGFFFMPLWSCVCDCDCDLCVCMFGFASERVSGTSAALI